MKKIAITQQDPGTGGVDSLTGFNLESLSTYREAFVLTQKSNIEYCFLLNSYITVEVSHPCNFFDKMIEKSLIGIHLKDSFNQTNSIEINNSLKFLNEFTWIPQ